MTNEQIQKELNELNAKRAKIKEENTADCSDWPEVKRTTPKRKNGFSTATIGKAIKYL